ncbi:hypothetical protein BKG80_05870 [Mycobacteroides chelonae]|uniref:hypothetical protein n=1 Tax=Mycobacteroides chelonae TaxID=1774 RepID=UPI00091D5663|nr:hypothetical protein [Mycobacteroides chelonae]MBF9352824.1 hypothetical protein [Mycobacteroides chelonae]OHU42432.1 hypothetical protein BKG80_05870 [Mycobacteroides chelonae]
MNFSPIDELTPAQAWLRTVLQVWQQPEKKAFHVVTHIRSVQSDGEPRILSAAADLLDGFGLQPTDTVANTLFPEALAGQTSSATDLSERYLELLPQLKRLDDQNRYGTYFQRLIAYPSPADAKATNQLARVVTNLQKELASKAPKSARYETSLEIPCDSAGTAAAPIHEPGRDNRSMGFPCLSFLSFQHDKTYLHAVAHYRYQYLIERGLGNYLGIARLVRYIASQTGLQPGALTVIAGRANVDHLKAVHVAGLTALDEALATLSALPA